MAYYSCGNLYLSLVQKHVCPFSFSYTNTNQFAIALPAAAEGEKTVYASIFYQFLVSRLFATVQMCWLLMVMEENWCLWNDRSRMIPKTAVCR